MNRYERKRKEVIMKIEIYEDGMIGRKGEGKVDIKGKVQREK